MSLIVLIRGGGDLASGVAFRLHRAGIWLIITELPQPLAVRRFVSFSEAVYQKEIIIEGVTARLATDFSNALSIIEAGKIPVLVDPDCKTLLTLKQNHDQTSPLVVIDGRMTKKSSNYTLDEANLIIGLGPGFTAGINCHAAIETKRGHFMGRVIWDGSPLADTGIPEGLGEKQSERVIRSPADGKLMAHAVIGDRLETGQPIAEISGLTISAPFKGVLRGIIHPSIRVWKGLKIGDVDPRDDPGYCTTVSDKSLAVGGGVLEALLSRPNFRGKIWDKV